MKKKIKLSRFLKNDKKQAEMANRELNLQMFLYY